ncbi:hypothetical protein ACFSHP_19455 [Novosphingobium panipatense]
MSSGAGERARAVMGYDPKIATNSEEEFAELMALARERPPLTPMGNGGTIITPP